ncbi:T9SS type A sorting domain-containing protein [Flammeovirga sp. MY04]|uniref:T9SS type A sorting domain-containing protein n=1 Tax=Flammeovirga sp. MY04 TaxID=1191459 RepID=UPI0008062605|nr:T9SS type A sorting domain-containing protein [Flammeovirga sp. MY04]ANQ50137.1 T9SS type A sorting domain-containing protein [Flammeovirga sp. MY04]
MKNINYYYLIAVFLLLIRYDLYAQCSSAPSGTWTESCTYISPGDYILNADLTLNLGGSSLTIDVENNTFIYGGGLLDGATTLTIPAGDTLIVNGDFSLRDNVNLVVDGVLHIYGEMDNSGFLNGGGLNTLSGSGKIEARNDINFGWAFDWDILGNADGWSGTIVDNDSDLPVELTYFNASINTIEVILAWETATEINASHFLVQRSTDKTNWSTIGKVEANGNTNFAIEYKFIDNSPLSHAYYRLHQFDFDGQNEIFGPVEVHMNSNNLSGFDVVLMPNSILPSQDLRTSISGLNINSAVQIQLYDGNGRGLYTEQFEASAVNLFKEFKLPLNLQPGVYYMVFQNGAEVKRKRLVIK